MKIVLKSYLVQLSRFVCLNNLNVSLDILTLALIEMKTIQSRKAGNEFDVVSLRGSFFFPEMKEKKELSGEEVFFNFFYRNRLELSLNL